MSGTDTQCPVLTLAMPCRATRCLVLTEAGLNFQERELFCAEAKDGPRELGGTVLMVLAAIAVTFFAREMSGTDLAHAWARGSAMSSPTSRSAGRLSLYLRTVCSRY
eukprot:2779023-Rhodomonas_salina.2